MPHDGHHKCMASALAQAEQTCAVAGLRFTPLRRQVFEVIWQSHKAMTAMDVLSALGKEAQPPTAYRALGFLQQHGLVHYVASLNAYVGCVCPGQDHTGQLLICTQCRDVAEVDVTPLANTLSQQAAKQGFRVAHNHIELLGTCKKCQQN